MAQVYVVTHLYRHMVISDDCVIDPTFTVTKSEVVGVFATRELAFECLYEMRKFHRTDPDYDRTCVEEWFDIAGSNHNMYTIETIDGTWHDRNEYEITKVDIIEKPRDSQ